MIKKLFNKKTIMKRIKYSSVLCLNSIKCMDNKIQQFNEKGIFVYNNNNNSDKNKINNNPYLNSNDIYKNYFFNKPINLSKNDNNFFNKPINLSKNNNNFFNKPIDLSKNNNNNNNNSKLIFEREYINKEKYNNILNNSNNKDLKSKNIDQNSFFKNQINKNENNINDKNNKLIQPIIVGQNIITYYNKNNYLNNNFNSELNFEREYINKEKYNNILNYNNEELNLKNISQNPFLTNKITRNSIYKKIISEKQRNSSVRYHNNKNYVIFEGSYINREVINQNFNYNNEELRLKNIIKEQILKNQNNNNNDSNNNNEQNTNFLGKKRNINKIEKDNNKGKGRPKKGDKKGMRLDNTLRDIFVNSLKVFEDTVNLIIRDINAKIDDINKNNKDNFYIGKLDEYHSCYKFTDRFTPSLIKNLSHISIHKVLDVISMKYTNVDELFHNENITKEVFSIISKYKNASANSDIKKFFLKHKDLLEKLELLYSFLKSNFHDLYENILAQNEDFIYYNLKKDDLFVPKQNKKKKKEEGIKLNEKKKKVLNLVMKK